MSLLALSSRQGNISYVITFEDDETIRAEVATPDRKEERNFSSWCHAQAWIDTFFKTKNYTTFLD